MAVLSKNPSVAEESCGLAPVEQTQILKATVESKPSKPVSLTSV
jgi:hypothetical protein